MIVTIVGIIVGEVSRRDSSSSRCLVVIIIKVESNNRIRKMQLVSIV